MEVLFTQSKPATLWNPDEISGQEFRKGDEIYGMTIESVATWFSAEIPTRDMKHGVDSLRTEHFSPLEREWMKHQTGDPPPEIQWFHDVATYLLLFSNV